MTSDGPRPHQRAGTDLPIQHQGIGAEMCKGDATFRPEKCFPARSKLRLMASFSSTPHRFIQEQKFENVCLEFKEGKIVKATANKQPAIE